MKKFVAALRRILLAITMIIGLVICVLHLKIESTAGTFLTLAMVASGALYLLISVISLLVRFINRVRMDESDRMKESFMGVLTYSGNSQVLAYFRRLSFWGTIMLLVNFCAFNLTPDMVLGGPYSPDVFLAGYHGFLLWASLALPAMFLLSVIFFAVYMPHYGTGAYNVFQYTGKMIMGDITAPFSIIKNIFIKDDKAKKERIKDAIRLITILAFVAVNVIAIIKSV